MYSTQEAQDYIEELARRKGTFTANFREEAEAEARNGRPAMLQIIQGSEEIREDLSKALKIISADLYTNKARFLMEIIQNADDNKYLETETPTISITIKPDLIKIECNETGFRDENVQALCRTGRSTKSPGKGYTGEKGIGFKSVFKIAKRAHIRSPPFYFQLDQDRELGMITPQWDKSYFDLHPQQHQTTIILDRISDSSTNFSRALQDDIKSISPAIMLFLRRIQRLHLIVYGSSSSHPTTLSRRFRLEGGNSSLEIISLTNEDSGTTDSYYKVGHSTTFNGAEARRPNISTTEIILAFPIQRFDHFVVTHSISCYTYAYLPIGAFGFKFLIQGDFLMTSNRQSVDEDNAWNKNIARAIPRAFVEAVHTFNKTYPTSLATTWPLYMTEDSSVTSGYWRIINNDIATALRTAAVIKTRIGTFQSPSSVVFLDWAHDRDGNPLFGLQEEYVSPDYPSSVRPVLSSLGVVSPNWAWVFDRLLRLHNTTSLHSTSRTQSWYSDLAKVILEAIKPFSRREYFNQLCRIPLIPLDNGTWATAATASDPIYFPISLGTTIPPGLNFKLVEREACNCPYRTKLFKALGVKDCDVNEIVKRIIEHHKTFKRAIRGDIKKQVIYLYQARNDLNPGDMKHINFGCHNNKLFRFGRNLYVDTSDERSLEQLFNEHQNACFLDTVLFNGLDSVDKDQFVQWLQKEADIATFPRLCSGHIMHNDFVWLLQNRRDQVLEILRKNWNSYESGFSMSTIWNRVAECSFPCRTGRDVELRHTFIPTTSLLEKCGMICDTESCSFIILPNNQPSQWLFLSRFGVGVLENIDFYLWILSQPGFKAQANIERAKVLYRKILEHGWARTDQDKIRRAFLGKTIALPSGTYVSPGDCVYFAPEGFSSSPVLFSIYGDSFSELFRNILKVPLATNHEVLTHLTDMRLCNSATMAEVADAQWYLEKYCSETCKIAPDFLCIAVPSSESESTLVWKAPYECVWDDKEFSQNGLKIQSKISLRQIIQQHAPKATAFFTNILKLQDAGLEEFLGDLELMEQNGCDDQAQVDLLYERIQNYRRGSSGVIKTAFTRKPLIFLRGYNGERGQWLHLDKCVWTRSVLRSKYSLMGSLNAFRPLIRDTLGVSNATTGMLITELLNTTRYVDSARVDDTFQYCKDILLDLTRARSDDASLGPLNTAKCWPCRTTSGEQAFCAIGDFFVNDRQDLFNVFSDRQCFLDFDFETSKKFTRLLQSRECESFLSKKVVVRTDTGQDADYDEELTQEYSKRADALKKYFEHVECRSQTELGSLLGSVRGWTSANIKTHYDLQGSVVTVVDGGSSVRVEASGTTHHLDIFFSRNKQLRDYAMVTQLAGQLITALKIEPQEFPHLQSCLTIPVDSLNMLLIQKGIIGDSIDGSVQTGHGSHDTDGHPRYQQEQPEAEVTIEITSSASSRRSDSVAPTRSVQTELIPLSPRPPPTNSIGSSQPDTNTVWGVGNDVEEVPPALVSGSTYTAVNRSRNRDQLRSFARSSNAAGGARTRSGSHSRNNDAGSLDLGSIAAAIEQIQPTPRTIPVHVQRNTPRRRRISDRNEEERARDFEVGFLGEQFVYYLLHDELKLPGFSGEINWTSSLRARAGFPSCRDEGSDFTYHDAHGALTRYFQQLVYPYSTPEWLSTVCTHDNKPTYHLEVKTTTSQDPTTTFYMSGNQYNLVRRTKVSSATPSDIYAIIRVSGLDVLEGGERNRPEWRVYLDPYSLETDGVLDFYAATWTVTAAT